MAVVTDSIVVRAPVDVVFRYLVDAGSALEWMDGMMEFRAVGPVRYGLGARVQARHRVLGVPIALQLEIVEFIEGEKLVSLSEGLVQSVSTWACEVVPEGTKVSFLGSYRLAGVPLAPFADSMLKHEVSGHIARSLRNLQRVLTRRAGGDPA